MKIRNFLLLIAAVMITACSSPERKVLVQADSVMEENPDSAMSILNGLSRNDLKGDDLAYYSLLYTQAQVKTDVPLNSDSLISIAYAKYSGASRGDKGIRSNFYTGEVFFNQDQPRDAMRYYLTAYEESKRLGNDYWRAKSAERIADLFFFAYNYDEAEKYNKEAIEYYGRSGRCVNQRYAIVDLGIVYINEWKTEEASDLLDSLYKVCIKETPKDDYLLEYIRRPMIDALVDLNRVSELDSADYKLLDSKKNSIDNNILKSNINIINGNHNDYDFILNNINSIATTDEDKGRILYARYENAKAGNNYLLAIDFIDSLLHYQSSVAARIISESVTSAQRDFYSAMAVRNRDKSKHLFLLLVLCITVSLIIGFTFWRFYRLRETTRRAELEASIESFIALKAHSDKLIAEKSMMAEQIRNNDISLNKLKQQITEKDIVVKRLEKEINEKLLALEDIEKKMTIQSSIDNNRSIILETLFKEKWGTLNMLCDEYYERGESQKLREHIITNIEKELKKICTPQGLTQIEDAVNKYMEGIIAKLRYECSFLNAKDITFAMLIIAGFSVKAVCFMTGIKTGNFYVKKKRLLTRIACSDALNRDIFIDRLR